MARIDLERDGKTIKTFEIGAIERVLTSTYSNRLLSVDVKYSSEKAALDAVEELYSRKNNLSGTGRNEFRQSLTKQLASGMNAYLSLDEFLRVSLDWDEWDRVTYQVFHPARMSIHSFF
ncbi:hypothetical protein J4207_05170 [Candidatus Woesearchaeota archaeon]|nr:hypothetical protein [Candidatus Woesearchaeota archaeon]HLC80374.1 hypothetical protein [Candidatus Nanoarchaeia archaeon]